MAIFLFLAILGFIASLLVHAATFLDRPSLTIDRAWPLHVGIFLVLIPALLAQRQMRDGKPNPPMREQFSYTPRWMLVVLGVFFGYAIVNLVLTSVLHSGRGALADKAELRDGRYVVMRNGAVGDEVTETEYFLARARTARAFSGQGMMLYWMSAVGTLDGLRRRRAEDAARPRPPMLRPTARTASAYTLDPAPRLSPWAHASLQMFIALVCFFAFPVAVFLPIASVQKPAAGAGCVAMALFFPAALTGLFLPAFLFRRHVPARCPACSGRTFCDRFPQQQQPVTYTCRNCAHVYALGGSG